MVVSKLDLVMMRLPNNPEDESRQRHYNVWFRVMFIDNDGTFIGICEKLESGFNLYKKGEHLKLEISKVQRIYQKGEQFCYSDDVTICECVGLCKNK